MTVPLTILALLMMLNACGMQPVEITDPGPTLDPCIFELPPLPTHELRTKDDGSAKIYFDPYGVDPEEWLLVTDEHPDSFVILYEDGGTAISLPVDYEMVSLDNGNVQLRLPGCRLGKN